MKLLPNTCLAAAFAAVFGSALLAQDFEKGLAAYELGDFTAALNEWRPLAEQGSVDAQLRLGWMYATEQGVELDNVEAVKWYRLAAEQGATIAQLNLGYIYLHGRGVLQDFDGAFKWFVLAAKQGDRSGQRALGEIYSRGHGIQENNVKSHMWYNIASANGDANASNMRDNIAEKMTPDDISQAQSMARECMESAYKECGW